MPERAPPDKKTVAPNSLIPHLSQCHPPASRTHNSLYSSTSHGTPDQRNTPSAASTNVRIAAEPDRAMAVPKNTKWRLAPSQASSTAKQRRPARCLSPFFPKTVV